MRPFDVLFDVQAQSGTNRHPAYDTYGGTLALPLPPGDRPWIYSNFVQTLDGIVSLKGRDASGAHISQSAEDRWLMDLLRAHADAVILGVGTLIEERALAGTDSRGPVYRVEDPLTIDLRRELTLGREMNVFVTGSAALVLGDYAVFDGDLVDAIIVTTKLGAARLAQKKSHPHVRIIVSGECDVVDMAHAVGVLRKEFGIRRLLCEGGPTLYGWMDRAALIDEKFLTVSPVEVGQEIPPEQEPSETEKVNPPKLRPTIFGAPGFTRDKAPWWDWISCRRVGNHQFSRYRRRRNGHEVGI